MGVKAAKWFGYGFDGLTVLLLGLSLHWALLRAVSSVPLTVVMFLVVFLPRILMRYPVLFAYRRAWGVEGEARRQAAPYGVARIKSISALLGGLPVMATLSSMGKWPLATCGTMLPCLARAGGWSAVFLMPVRRMGRKATV